MKCISPISIAQTSARDRELVPCGKCGYCLQNKRAEWTFRLNQELKISESAKFLTITYEDEHIRYTKFGDPELEKRDIQLFTKRLRKANLKQAWKYFPKIKTQAELSKIIPSLRYYTVGEYGSTTDRPHYHSIMFNMQPEMEHKLQEIWKKGYVHAGQVTPASIAYVTKYVINKEYRVINKNPPFSLMSRNPGLGSNYLEATKYHQENKKLIVTNPNGTKQALPKFYKNKMFSKYDLEEIKINSQSKIDNKEEQNRIRLERLGNDPSKYIQQQHQINLKKITSKDKKQTL